MSPTTTDSTSSDKATITCFCGKVKLTLPNASPKYRSGCCCTECLQRAHIGSNGNPPAAVKHLAEPVDLFYVDSQIMNPDLETLANLAVFKLNTVDAPNMNLRATCCGAVLCTENQEFHVPHSMATFNNLRPFVKCEFSNVPESRMNVFTKDWPEEKRKALAFKDQSTRGDALPQIFDPRTALEEEAIIELISPLQTKARQEPGYSISFAELCDSMEVTIEQAYYHESRAHLPGEAP
jgi:hypothetical protein